MSSVCSPWLLSVKMFGCIDCIIFELTGCGNVYGSPAAHEFVEGKGIPHEQVKRESLEFLNRLAANRKRVAV